MDRQLSPEFIYAIEEIQCNFDASISAISLFKLNVLAHVLFCYLKICMKTCYKIIIHIR